jgi:hypothetical protein
VQRQRLLAAASLDDTELDLLPRLEGGDPFGQRVGTDVDVAAVVLGQEAEALVCVVEADLASRHAGPH